MSAMYDRQDRSDFTPALTDRGGIVQCQNVLELMMNPAVHDGCSTIQAPSLDEARLISEYNFFKSNAVVARW